MKHIIRKTAAAVLCLFLCGNLTMLAMAEPIEEPVIAVENEIVEIEATDPMDVEPVIEDETVPALEEADISDFSEETPAGTVDPILETAEEIANEAPEEEVPDVVDSMDAEPQTIEPVTAENAPSDIPSIAQSDYEPYGTMEYIISAGQETVALFDVPAIFKISGQFGQTAARSMLSMINTFRKGSDAWYWASDDTTKVECSGLSDLTYDYDLEKIAMQRAAEIAISFDHVRPDGTSLSTALSEFSYYAYGLGENIAAGYSMDAAEAFELWQENKDKYNGQGHRRNMLNQSYNRIGIGHFTFEGIDYWVQEFALSDMPISYTYANDQATDVEVSILDSYVTSLNGYLDKEQMTLREGASEALPVIEVFMNVVDHFGSEFPIEAIYTWKVNDSLIAEISGNELLGIAAGSTELVAEVLGNEVTIPVTVEHDPVAIPEVPATCTEDGLTEGSRCAICGKIIEEQEVIPAIGHDWGSWKVIKAASIKDEGLEQRVCRRDGTHVETRTIPKRTEPFNFTDVANTARFYYAPVYWAAENGITTGTSETTFSPNQTCSRAQVVTFLWRLAGEPTPQKTGFFYDVPANAFYYDAVYWAAEKGITTGTSPTTFDPTGDCTRGHVVTFLWRYLGKQLMPSTGQFKDVPGGKFYYEAVYWALAKNITTGTSDTTFQPDVPCTRGQVVTFLYRATGH